MAVDLSFPCWLVLTPDGDVERHTAYENRPKTFVTEGDARACAERIGGRVVPADITISRRDPLTEQDIQP